MSNGYKVRGTNLEHIDTLYSCAKTLRDDPTRTIGANVVRLSDGVIVAFFDDHLGIVRPCQDASDHERAILDALPYRKDRTFPPGV